MIFAINDVAFSAESIRCGTLNADLAAAAVDGDGGLVEAVEAIFGVDDVRPHGDVIQIPPAIIAPRIDRRDELLGQADATAIAP